MSDDIPELTPKRLRSAIAERTRRRLAAGDYRGGGDVVALRTFVQLTQREFADAMGISIHTLRNWEQDRRRPEGPAIALLRIAARHPKIFADLRPRAA